MSFRSRVASGANRSATAVRSADRNIGGFVGSAVDVVGGIAKISIVAIAGVLTTSYLVEKLDEPAKEIATDVSGVFPDMKNEVTVRSPILVDNIGAPAGTNPNAAGWSCTEGVRDDGTITDFLGRMVIAEYGLGDYNDSAVYDQAISLLQTPEFSALNPHIDDINEPPMGKDIFFPNCELR